MLDILRSTPETKDIKVIMMTALSSEDQRERGEHLGADRYLVKSQVGIEDVVNVVHEVLGDRANDGTIRTDADGAAPVATGVASSASGVNGSAPMTAGAAPAAPVATGANGVGAVTAEPANEGVALTIPQNGAGAV